METQRVPRDYVFCKECTKTETDQTARIYHAEPVCPPALGWPYFRLLRDHEEWVDHLVTHGYIVNEETPKTEPYVEPEDYPCYVFAPKNTDHPVYLQPLEMQEMLDVLVEAGA